MKSKKLAQLVRISALKRDVELGRMAFLTTARTALQAERSALRDQVAEAMRTGQASVTASASADGFAMLAQQMDANMALAEARLASDIATQKSVAALAVGRASVIDSLARK